METRAASSLYEVEVERAYISLVEVVTKTDIEYREKRKEKSSEKAGGCNEMVLKPDRWEIYDRTNPGARCEVRVKNGAGTDWED